MKRKNDKKLTPEEIKAFDPNIVYTIMAEPLKDAQAHGNMAATALLRMMWTYYSRFVAEAYINMDKTFYFNLLAIRRAMTR